LTPHNNTNNPSEKSHPEALTRDVTERKRAEEAHARLAAIVESSDDAILSKTLDGIITSWNGGAERIYGYPAEEVVGRPISILAPSERGDEIPAILQSIRRGKRVDHFETVRVRKDGGRIDVSITVSPIRDSKGNVIGASTVARDITERKRTQEEIHQLNKDLEYRVEERTSQLEAAIAELQSSQEALRRSEERFRLLVENVEDYAIFMLDPAGHVVSWNEGAERIQGYQVWEVLGEHFSVFYTEEDVERGLPEEELRVAAIEGHFEEEGVRVRKDGTRFRADVVITALSDEVGNLRGFSQVTRDITARKEAEEALRGSLRQLADLKAALDESAMVAITDGEGKITYVNDKFCEVSKYYREELLGQDHRIVNSGYHTEEFMEDLWNTIGRGNVWRGAFRNRAQDGSIYWVEATIVPFLDETNRLDQYFAICHDITRYRETE